MALLGLRRAPSQFKRTALARRFPGLRDLREADLTALILAERRATGHKREPEARTYPKTDFAPSSPKREREQQATTPFFPSSRTQAKDTIALPESDVRPAAPAGSLWVLPTHACMQPCPMQTGLRMHAHRMQRGQPTLTRHAMCAACHVRRRGL